MGPNFQANGRSAPRRVFDRVEASRERACADPPPASGQREKGQILQTFYRVRGGGCTLSEVLSKKKYTKMEPS
jgi:hypothetical protein